MELTFGASGSRLGVMENCKETKKGKGPKQNVKSKKQPPTRNTEMHGQSREKITNLRASKNTL